VAQNTFTVNICGEIMKEIKDKIIHESKEYTDFAQEVKTYNIIYTYGIIGRILLSLMMFIIYSIVPELRNIHGFILRRYSGSIFIGETVRLTDVLIIGDMEEDIICIASGTTYSNCIIKQPMQHLEILGLSVHADILVV